MFTVKQKRLNLIFSFFVVSLLLPLISLSQVTIDIQVSPNVLNLQNNGQVVTIHTDIAYSTVAAESVFLNGVEIQSWKADNNGNFVAKFNMEAIQGLDGLVVDDYNTFTLEGLMYGGGEFTGSEDILVVDNVPQGRK